MAGYKPITYETCSHYNLSALTCAFQENSKMVEEKASSVHFFWNSLPADTEKRLLWGSIGKHHLLNLSEIAQQTATTRKNPSDVDHLTALAADLLLAAWEHDPLDGLTSSNLLKYRRFLPSASPVMLDIFQKVARNWSKPEQNSFYYRLLQRNDASKLKNFLEQTIRKESGNLFWWQQVFDFGHFNNDPGWVRHCTQMFWPSLLNFLEPTLLARGSQCRHDKSCSLEKLEGQIEEYQSAASRCKHLGDHAWAQGQREAAIKNWSRSLLLRPWQSTLLLRLYDLINDREGLSSTLSGKTMILLYSWNKADALDETLASLAESERCESKILVLNNGSSDETISVLTRWQEALGQHIGIISLPVNVGAPAARNWLMALPECREADWLAYLDDDVALPKDWLTKLGGAVKSYPEAGVWGCKVVEYADPDTIQSSDLHVLPSPSESRTEPWVNFQVSELQKQVRDEQQFSYMRPCVSVTGCCHLFSRKQLEQCGEFDLRFSPSQFDDIDHDLRRALSGKMAVYQGHLKVRHMKKVGWSHTNSPALNEASLGNMYKLYHKYTDAMAKTISENNYQAIRQDLHRKLDFLKSHFHKCDLNQ